MLIFIRLYPLFALCLAYISVEFARDLRRKGKRYWLLPAFLFFIFIGSIYFWWSQGAYQNAEQWAKEWANSKIF